MGSYYSGGSYTDADMAALSKNAKSIGGKLATAPASGTSALRDASASMDGAWSASCTLSNSPVLLPAVDPASRISRACGGLTSPNSCLLIAAEGKKTLDPDHLSLDCSGEQEASEEGQVWVWHGRAGQDQGAILGPKA